MCRNHQKTTAALLTSAQHHSAWPPRKNFNLQGRWKGGEFNAHFGERTGSIRLYDEVSTVSCCHHLWSRGPYAMAGAHWPWSRLLRPCAGAERYKKGPLVGLYLSCRDLYHGQGGLYPNWGGLCPVSHSSTVLPPGRHDLRSWLAKQRWWHKVMPWIRPVQCESSFGVGQTNLEKKEASTGTSENHHKVLIDKIGPQSCHSWSGEPYKLSTSETGRGIIELEAGLIRHTDHPPQETKDAWDILGPAMTIINNDHHISSYIIIYHHPIIDKET